MNVSSVPILTLVTFLPLLGALVVAVLPSGLTRQVALGFALATWAVSLLLLIGYLPGREGAQFEYRMVLRAVGTEGVRGLSDTLKGDRAVIEYRIAPASD